MARRCATQKKSQSNASAEKPSSYRWRIPLLAVVGALAAYVAYDRMTLQGDPVIAEAEETIIMPRFEFYQLLAETDVPLADSNREAIEYRVATSNVQYVIQVASVQSHADAQLLQGELAALGFEVDIYPYQSEDTQWYRLRLGPFATEPTALDMQRRLLCQDITAVILQVEGVA